MTAFFAQTFEMPSFSVRFSSAKTSIPYFISMLLIQNVLRKPAQPLAMALTKELIIINLLPVRFLEMPAKAFLRKRDIPMEEPTAMV
jgi:hypothetical protein